MQTAQAIIAANKAGNPITIHSMSWAEFLEMMAYLKKAAR